MLPTLLSRRRFRVRGLLLAGPVSQQAVVIMWWLQSVAAAVRSLPIPRRSSAIRWQRPARASTGQSVLVTLLLVYPAALAAVLAPVAGRPAARVLLPVPILYLLLICPALPISQPAWLRSHLRAVIPPGLVMR